MGGKGTETEEGNGNGNEKGMTGMVAGSEEGMNRIGTGVEAESVTVEEIAIMDKAKIEPGTGITDGTGIGTGSGAGIVTEVVRGSSLGDLNNSALT